MPKFSVSDRAAARPFDQRHVGRHGDRRLAEADLGDDEERDQEEDQQPQERHGDHQRAAGDRPRARRPAQRRHPLDHALMRQHRAGVSAQETQTVSSQVMASSSKRDRLVLVACSTLPALEPQPIDRHVADIGDVLDHRREDVGALLRPLAGQPQLLRPDRVPEHLVERAVDAVADVDVAAESRALRCGCSRARPRSPAPRTCSPTR